MIELLIRNFIDRFKKKCPCTAHEDVDMTKFFRDLLNRFHKLVFAAAVGLDGNNPVAVSACFLDDRIRGLLFLEKRERDIGFFHEQAA